MKLDRRRKLFVKFLVGFLVGYFVVNSVIHASKSANPTLFDQNLSKVLFNEVRIACVVNTGPINHRTKAIYVKKTWGQKCNKLFFVSTEHDPELNPIVVPLNDSRNILRQKVRAGFLHVHDNHLDEIDWLLKADDDK
jgi:glycoprotein-N-acetylgalactosamine 3-beta-galactosyltransferase